MTTALLVHHKLELAVVAFINARKGGLLNGVHILSGHSNLEPARPFLAVWGGQSTQYSDFAGLGRAYPETVNLVIGITGNAADATFTASVGQWLSELDSIITARTASDAPDYSDLIAYCNTIADPDVRPVTGLYLYAVHQGPISDALGDDYWDGSYALEVVCQNGDPS